MTFGEHVRDELAHLPLDPVGGLEAEALIRIGGSLVRSGGSERAGLGAVFRSGSGAATRRLRALLAAVGSNPSIEVHRPTGLHPGATYHLRLAAGDPGLERCGVLDDQGRPAPPVRPQAGRPRNEVLAYLRGAVLAGGRFSDPRSAAHLELPAPGPATAKHLARLLRRAGAPVARAGAHGDSWRVVVKSGEQIGALLAALGATSAFLDWDDARLRRELRGAANRVANADRANLARSVGAAARAVEAIERLLATPGWEELPEDLRSLALARVANPEASLTELGALLDPPVGKSTVHRRLQALTAAAERLLQDDPGGA